MKNTTVTQSLYKYLRTLMVPFFILSLVAFDVSAAIGSMGEAINKAGRQRMLSQRIAQSYIQIGIQPGSPKATKQLARSVVEFDRNLQELKAFVPAESIASDLAAIESLWAQYRTLAEGSVNKDNGALLLEQSNIILSDTHAYVVKLEAIFGGKKAELINIAGRQRMLSQRIAKNFLAKHWGLEADISTEGLYEDMAGYEKVLSYLAESDMNTPAINTQLGKVKGQFIFASKGFDGVMSLSGQRLVHVVAGSTDSMLYGMNKVTGMYAELLAE